MKKSRRYKFLKKTRKLMLLLLIATLIISIIPANAVSSTKLDNIDYYSDDIPVDKLDQIIKSMYGIFEDDITPRSSNPLCWVGLHSKQTGTIFTIHHNFYSTHPKCRETRTNVEYCTRDSCTWIIVTGESSMRILCCP